MSEPELHVRDLTPPLLTIVCDSGRHIAHPGETCEETDELRAVFRTWFETWMVGAYSHAEQVLLRDMSITAVDQISIVGNGMRGFLPLADEPEPSPGERAFAILEPHLTDAPLYRPKFARGGILPKGFGATADAPLCRSDCRWPVVR